MYCNLLLNCRASEGFKWPISDPSKVICPAVRGCIPITVLPKVDFPHPDSPTIPSISPFLTSRETSSIALSQPILLFQTLSIENHFERLLTCNIGPSSSFDFLKALACPIGKLLRSFLVYEWRGLVKNLFESEFSTIFPSSITEI